MNGPPFTFLGCPCPAELARRLADRMVLREEHPGGRHVMRMRTENRKPVRPAVAR